MFTFSILAGQFSNTSLQQWNGYREISTSMSWLKGLSRMAENLCYLQGFLLPTIVGCLPMMLHDLRSLISTLVPNTWHCVQHSHFLED
jgi:hypothetical protein